MTNREVDNHFGLLMRDFGRLVTSSAYAGPFRLLSKF